MKDVKELYSSRSGVYILKYTPNSFSDEEKSKFDDELTKLEHALSGSVIYGSREYFRGKRFIIHGMSADGTEFTHKGKLLPYQNTTGYEVFHEYPYGSAGHDYLIPSSDYFCFNHLVEFTNTFLSKNGFTYEYVLKYLFNGNGAFDGIDPSCLYILDIYDEISGEKIVENINKDYYIKKMEELGTEKKQSGTDAEGSKLDPVSQKLHENIGKLVILNGELGIVSSFRINDDGYPCVVLGNDLTNEIVVDEVSSVIVPLAFESDENPKIDFIWSEPITNNPQEFADIVSKRKKYMELCKTNGQPSPTN